MDDMGILVKAGYHMAYSRWLNEELFVNNVREWSQVCCLCSVRESGVIICVMAVCVMAIQSALSTFACAHVAHQGHGHILCWIEIIYRDKSASGHPVLL